MSMDGYPDYFDNPVKEEMFKFEELTPVQVKDVFILLLIGIMISISVYIFEISFKSNQKSIGIILN